MRILVTRPREDADDLASKLRAAGHEVIIEPLLELRPVADAAIDLDQVQAILFTSANGVRAFAAREPRRDLPVYTVGDATAAEARAAGFSQVESARGDVGDLVALVKTRLKPENGVVFHAAGRDVAGDLAGELSAAGFEVRRAVLYTAEAVQKLSLDVIGALRDGRIDVVIFYSRRTADTFRRLIDQNHLAGTLGRTKAVAISPSAFEPLAGLRWAGLDAPPRPDEDELLKVVERLSRVPDEAELLKGIERLTTSPEKAAPPPPPIEPAAGTTPLPEFGGPPPAAAATPKPAQAPRPKSRLLVPMVWLAVLLALGTFILQMLQQNRPLPDAAGPAALRLDSRLGSLERQVAGLARDSRSTDPAVDGRLKQIEARVAALESKPASTGGLSADDTARIAELAQRIETLEAATAKRPDAGDLAAMMAENRRLAADLARVQEQMSSLEAGRDRAVGREALLLAAGQFALVAGQGQSIAAPTATLRKLGEDEPRIAAALQGLPANAERPIPTVDSLIQRFPEIAREAVRIAQTGDQGVADGSTLTAWWNGVLRRLSQAVTIRRVGDIQGNTLEARIARTEQRLAARDLAAAVAGLDGVEPPAATVFADWLTDARARVALDRVVNDVSAAALAAAAPGR